MATESSPPQRDHITRMRRPTSPRLATRYPVRRRSWALAPPALCLVALGCAVRRSSCAGDLRQPEQSASGFTVDRRLPVLAVTPTTFQPSARLADVDVGMVADEPSLLAAAQVQNAAYQVAEATAADVNRLRRLVGADGRVALAYLDGLPVGAGLSTAPAQGASEVAAVGVLAEFRRRGVATAVTATLTHDLLTREVVSFLQAEHASECALYERLGYSTVAEMTFATLPASKQ